MKPDSFMSVPEAIELINSDTRQNPVYDVKRSILNIEYLRANMRGSSMNYTIFLLKRDENGKIVNNGVKYVVIESSRDANLLEYALVDHYKQASGKDAPDPESMGLEAFTTAVEDSDGRSRPQPRRNTSSKIKKGDDMQQGSSTVTTGDK